MVRHGVFNAFRVAPDAPRRCIVRVLSVPCMKSAETVKPDDGNPPPGFRPNPPE
jgi:hypothetical protein